MLILRDNSFIYVHQQVKRKEYIMTGSLQIKNGKYYAVINLIDSQGKRKQKWLATGFDEKNNKKKAEKFLREKLQEYEESTDATASDILFSDYVKVWLKEVEKSVDIITYQGYLSVSKSQIIPYFENVRVRLNQLSREDIQRYIDIKSRCGRIDGKGGLSPKTMKTHKLIIQLALKSALKNELIKNNPCKYITLPKLQKREVSFYTEKQLAVLFEAIKNEPLYPLVYFTVIFGLRRSEVLGLKWDSVNFEMNTITIKHTVVRFSSIVEKDNTKTASSFRSYPLTEQVKNLLISLKEQEEENRKLFGKEYNENDYIFKWADGRMYRPDYVTRKFSKLLELYELPHIRFHDLRHSCASLLIANGFTLKDIQEWLGHSDIRITANVYAHLDTERKKDIASSMSDKFNL